MEFADRCIVVTGASGALGRSVAAAFAQRGARLVLVGTSRDRLRNEFGADDERRALVAADLVDADRAEAMARVAIDRFGRVDALCHLAGAFRMGDPVHETSDADWDHLFDANVRTLRNACRALVPRMIERGGGRIVGVGAHAARSGVARMGAYVAAKAVVARLTETMSAELRDANINVNCVLPTILDTPANRAAMPGADFTRWVAPADLANVIVFLASDAARAVHGATIPVTGRV